jgi:Predicted membrane protein
MSLHPSVGTTEHPALIEHAVQRGASIQNRIADRITLFAGSMTFIYISVVWFGLWIGLGVEKYPYGLLTMIVSLEAIFLSTFVMISQNRADEKRQVLADDQWKIVQTEERQNEELIELSRKILELTTAIHQMSTRLVPPGPAPATGRPATS